MDLPNQVQVLKDRGLLIEDEQQALDKLSFISYYRLANYWRPMESDKETHQFKPGSRFSDIIILYAYIPASIHNEAILSGTGTSMAQ